LEVRRRAIGLAVGHFDQVQAIVGLNDVADLADFHDKSGSSDRLLHGVLAEEIADIAAVLRARTLRIFSSGLGEVELVGNDVLAEFVELGPAVLDLSVVSAGRDPQHDMAGADLDPAEIVFVIFIVSYVISVLYL